MNKSKLPHSRINFRFGGNVVLIFLFSLIAQLVYSQSKQGSYWYFGQQAGVYFNMSGSVTAMTNGATTGAVNLEGTATISDTAGNLKFYTDGMTVWNSNHSVMTNGTGLLGHSSSTQSAVIVPFPTSTDSFYIFTIDAAHNNLNNGLRYSVVKMSLSGGLGAVSSIKNILLSPTGVKVAEKITAVKHCNNRDIWVICHGYGATNGNKFYAYLITPSGVTTTPVISTVGTTHNGGDVTGYGNARGYMKASPDGRRIALTIPYDGCPYPPGNINGWTQGSVEVFNFSNRYGTITNPIKFTSANYKGSYGIEFSAGGTRLYASQWGSYNDPSTVWQWNLSAGSATAIQNSATLIASPTPAPGALQLALNGKIYIVKDYGTTFPQNGYLNAINYPNNLGTACGHTANAVFLGNGRYGRYGLPTFIQSYFDPGYNVSPSFVASLTSFSITDTTNIDSVYWTFGEPSSGANNHSRLFNPTHIYSDTGRFTVQLIIYKCGIADTLESPLPVYPLPDVNFVVNDTDQCVRGNSFSFTNQSTIISGSMTYLWNFGDNSTSTATNPTHTYATAGTYQVKLVATSNAGGKDSLIRNVYVRPKPSPVYSVNDSTQCLRGNSFVFNNTSTISSGTLTYLWRFGDATTSATKSPSHTYATANTFTVQMVAISNFGCRDSIASRHSIVYPQPSARFSISDSTQCQRGNSFTFTNQSVISSGTMTYAWAFGDGSTSTTTSPSHSYASNNTYNVKLVTTSGFGCKDSIVKNTYSYPMPVPAFTINDSTQCIRGNSFSFTNGSTVPSGTLTYLWRFGDGGTSASTNPAHSYATVNNYNVNMVAISNQGCRDSVTKRVYLYAMPVANYTVNDSTQCLRGNSFVFTNQSTSATSYKWSFGDATSSTATNPTKTYTTANTFQVKLVSTSGDGCNDSITKNMFVYPKPTPNYTINDNTQCFRGNNFAFTNTSTISSGTMSYRWTFGDGGTAITTNSTHTYATTGNFNVKLVATSNQGCPDSVTKTASVYVMPIAGFSINDSTQCSKGNNFIFTNSSTIGTGTMTYQWSFGDAISSTATSPSHTYTAAGTYTVRLVTSSNNLCRDTFTKTVYVYPSPSVNFSMNDSTQCLRGNNFVFTNSSSIGSGSMGYLWTFGDGGSAITTNSTHVYASSSTFNVKLIANSNLGCQDSAIKRAYVYPMPTTNFSINDSTQCFKGNNFVFTNSTTIGSGTVTYNWYFGDGVASTQTSPVHSYTSVNLFNVKLVSNSGFGCRDSITKRTYVFPSPNLGYSVNDSTQCLRGNNFVFTNSSSISSGSITYLWKFGDGVTAITRNTSHVYTTANNYTARLVVTSNLGCQDSVAHSMSVYAMPVTAFTINDSTQCLKANSFVFNNTSTIASGTITYNWLFGDGGTSTIKNPSKTYAAFATYNVKLVATSNFGCKDSITKRTYVYPDPVARFNINDTTQCQRGNSFIFSNTSSIGAGTYTSLWNFGDGATSSTTNTSHSFTSDDTFSVKLVVTSNNGCKDSVSKSAYVHPMPLTKFVNYDSNQCLERNRFLFLNQSVINSGTLSYLWKFGDGNTSTQLSPLHSYAAAGAYTVVLRATSDKGCIDSFSRATFLHIHPEPTAAYGINDSTQCIDGNNFIFTNNSTIASGTITTNWDFDDGTTTGTLSPSHTYLATDTFYAKLLVISDQGCKDSLLRTMIVNPMPQASFSVSDTMQCLAGNTFTFTNGSTISYGSNNYSWNFDDGNTSTDTSPVHVYANAGTYRVRLTVSSGEGCIDTLSHLIYVFPVPDASFSFIGDSSQCLSGNSFQLNNTTTIPAGSFSSFWDFGDGDTSNLTSPMHSYSIDSTFDIKLIVNTSYGCIDSITKQAVVNTMPIADFSINDSSQCFAGNTFIYTNLSIIKGNSYLKWYFGDGDSSAYVKPAHIYRTVDSFGVTLVVRSQKGCKDTMIRSAFTRPMPTASFTVNDSSQCLSHNSFNFTNTSSISKGQLYGDWSFGDGRTSKAKDTVYSYQSDGTFNVRMIINSEYSCSDTAFKKMIVYPMPVAGFTVNDTGQCIDGNSFVFGNTSNIGSGTMTYNWNLGDGTTTTQQNITHTYLTYDTFDVKLLTVSQNGCSDSMIKKVYTFAMPTAAFSINDTAQCEKGNSFSFSNSSTIGAGKFVNNWDFADGDTSMGISPVHSYLYSDSFKVELLLVSDHGCTDKASKMVWVYPMPLAAFLIVDTSQCLSGNIFDYVNGSVIKSGNLSYSWNLGDGTTSVLQDVTHSYSTADTYGIKLLVQSSKGCYDSISKNVYVRPHPRADFATIDSVQCFRGNSFSFTNGSAITSGSMTYAWDFGDGNSSAATDPQHSYNIADSFEVSLISYSDFNCTDTVKREVYVYPSPQADFTIDKTPQYLPFNKFNFTNKSVITGGLNSYIWDFGDGSTSVLIDPDHVYATADSFEVMLIANSDKGCTDTIRKYVQVMTASIIADFTYSNACKGDTVYFQNSSQIVNDTFLNFVWDFGDQSGSVNIEHPGHIYNDTGSYTVTMIAISKNGFKDTISHKVTILAGPTLNLTPDTTIYEGQKVTLTATGSFIQALWSTGAQTASIIADTQGLYSVEVTDANGCRSTGSVKVVVLERKKFSFMTIITPNGDGMNDLWKIDEIKQYQPCKLVIYNRWGDELFSDNNYNNTWDGTYKGKTLPEGTYYFVLETADGKVYKGAVNILK